MAEALDEFLVAAAMIEVAVAGYANNRLVVEKREFGAQRPDAQSRIEQQVPVAATQKPDIAEDVRRDVVFPDQRDVIAQGLVAEPGLGDWQRHDGNSVS